MEVYVSGGGPQKKQEHESVIIYLVIYFSFDFFLKNIIHSRTKSQVQNLPPPEIEPVTSEPGSETKAAIFP